MRPLMMPPASVRLGPVLGLTLGLSLAMLPALARAQSGRYFVPDDATTVPPFDLDSLPESRDPLLSAPPPPAVTPGDATAAGDDFTTPGLIGPDFTPGAGSDTPYDPTAPGPVIVMEDDGVEAVAPDPQDAEGAAGAVPKPTADPETLRVRRAGEALAPGDREILPQATQDYCVRDWPGDVIRQERCKWENRQALKRVTVLFMENAEGNPIIQAQFDTCRRRFFPDYRYIDYCISKELGLE